MARRIAVHCCLVLLVLLLGELGVTPSLRDAAAALIDRSRAPTAASGSGPTSARQGGGPLPAGGPADALRYTLPSFIEPGPDGRASVPGVSAEAYLVVDAGSGRILLEQRSQERRPIASLTKVMTALLTLESGALDDTVVVSDAVLSLGYNSTVMGISPGERLSVRNLLYGLLLPSGNDAAVVLAEHVGGSQAVFVARMNRRAQELGMADTRFANAHGLDARAGEHYSTARDLARLTQAALQNPVFRQIVNTSEWTAQGEKEAYHMFNGNLLLINYEGAEGVKIGFTDQAGQTLIGTVVQQQKRLLVVVLGSSHRVIDSMRLLDRAFPQVLSNPILSEFAPASR